MSQNLNSPGKNNNYYVVISGFRNLSMPCQSVNLAGIDTNATYMHARDTQNGIPLPADSLNYGDLVLDFIHDHKMISFFDIMEWFNAVHLNKTNLKEKDIYTTIELVVNDKQHKPILRLLYYNCIPSSIGEIKMSIKEDSTYLTNSVRVLYSHYSIINIESGKEIFFGLK